MSHSGVRGKVPQRRKLKHLRLDQPGDVWGCVGYNETSPAFQNSLPGSWPQPEPTDWRFGLVSRAEGCRVTTVEALMAMPRGCAHAGWACS